MKKINPHKSSAITFSILLILGITEGNSFASSVSANAEMSWSSLKITGSGSVIVYDPANYTKSWSRAGTYEDWNIPSNPYIFDSSDNQTGFVVTLAESYKANAFGSAYALGKTDTVPGENNIIASASAFATNYEDYSAMATAQRDICYEVTTTGNLTFSISYTLDSNIRASDGYGWANILAFTNLQRFDFNLGKWVDISTGYVTDEIVSGEIQFADYIYGPQSGTIAFTYAATAGQYLHLGAGVTAKAAAESAVPIPGAVWLLGSGLLGMIGIRRKSAK